MGTLLIKNGQIIDGTGADAFDGHVLIEDDRIKTIIENGQDLPQADEELDASGKVVSPGFIDMHSHSDWVLPLDDHDIALKCLLEQGVTTIIGGNCGFSPAPVTNKTRNLLGMEHFKLMVDKPLDYSWNTMGDFLDKIEEVKPIVNTAHQVGHGSIRFAMADTRRGALAEDEKKTCLDTLRQSLDDGACALSFGLGYDPGMYSPIAELESFCRVAASAEKCFKIVEDARKDGIDIMFDAFPYTCGNTTVNVVLPYWFLAKLPEGYKSWWSRLRLRVELTAGFGLVGFSYKDWQLMDASTEKLAEFNGHRFIDIARQLGVSPFEAVLKMSEMSQGQAVVLFHNYSGEPGNEKVLEDVLKNDLCLFETDALTRYGGYPNPAAMGTFPKILGHYVRERKLFSIENAVHRMTFASAARFNIKDRGVMEKGKKADVVIFDPKKIAEEPPRGSRPAGKPKGISHVFINGAHVVKDGDYINGMRIGEVIRV